MDHPRWGLILSVVANRDIEAGEELYGYYNYPRSAFPADHPWYFELQRKTEKEKRIKYKNCENSS